MFDHDLASILSNLLHYEITESDDVSMIENSKWDSLKHIEIIMSIEEFFNISFSPEEIPFLNTQQKILKRIKELKNV